MVRNAVVLTLLSLGLARELGCSSADAHAKGLNAPCTRSKDCRSDLVCDEGVCTDPDAGLAPVDGGPDATSTADASADGG